MTDSLDRTEQEAKLFRYMRSPAFRRRAKRLQKRIIDGGERPTFEAIAAELRVPVSVAIGGFMHSMVKHGYITAPPARTQ